MENQNHTKITLSKLKNFKPTQIKNVIFKFAWQPKKTKFLLFQAKVTVKHCTPVSFWRLWYLISRLVEQNGLSVLHHMLHKTENWHYYPQSNCYCWLEKLFHLPSAMIQVNEIWFPTELNSVMADYVSVYITGHYPLLILTLDRL